MLKGLAKILADVAHSEEVALNRHGEGIYFMPEIAYAYACGKAILENSEDLFAEYGAKWYRERDLGNGGPSDLLFELGGKRLIVVEFKMRDKLPAYLGDIQKLARIEGQNVARVFCVLLDEFTTKLPDARIERMQSQSPAPLTRLLDPFPSFNTLQSRYQGRISCTVAVWAVGDVPDWAS